MARKHLTIFVFCTALTVAAGWLYVTFNGDDAALVVAQEAPHLSVPAMSAAVDIGRMLQSLEH